MFINKNKLFISRNFDVFVFGILFIFVLVPRLQFIASWINRFKIRELLYIILYFRIFTFYKIHLTKKLIVVFIYLFYSIFIGVHTFFLYGSNLAYYGFIRFIGVALLAPLAATIFQDLKQVKYFISIWLGLVVIVAFGVLYQFFGGDLSFLQLPYYIASRSGLVRYHTIFGSPNVGGMASVIVYIYSILFVSKWPLKIVLLFSSIVLLLLSMSKAALGGFILATFLLIFRHSKVLFNTKKKTNSQIPAILLYTVMVIIVFAIIINIGDFNKYFSASFLSFFAGAENLGVYENLKYRLIGGLNDGIKLAFKESDFYVLNFFVGSSFGIVGSAAHTIRGDMDVILPHSSFSEIYLGGGMIMILIFTTILSLTYKQLKLKSNNIFYQPILLSFIIIVILIFTYPIIYEPVMGSFFWLIVGISCNYRLNRMK